MNIALTNFSDEMFIESRSRLNASAKRFGLNHIFSYSKEDIISTEFYSRNSSILSLPRGAGYWLWKPYIILESLKKLDENDILIYSDSGIEVIKELDPLVKICSQRQPVMLFANGNLINSEWTKRDCFILMDCDTGVCRHAKQCDGSFSLFKKTAFTIGFVEQWLQYGLDPRMFTDLPNTLGKKNSWRFIEHRHDQSVLSLMAFVNKIEYYRMPSQFGNHYKSVPYRIPGEYNCVNQKRPEHVGYYSSRPFNNSPYYQLLDQHRERKINGRIEARPFLMKLEDRIRKWL